MAGSSTTSSTTSTTFLNKTSSLRLSRLGDDCLALHFKEM
jgi:hypothetical protein